jgi:hypothetical protein
MIHNIKIKYLLLCCFAFFVSQSDAQERGVETVTFDFDKCPVLTHEVKPNAVTQHLNNFARLTIGVGENVEITSNKKVLNWEIANPQPCSGRIIMKENKKCLYEASVDPCDEVIIRATYEGSCVPQEKKFKVIAPTTIIFEKECGYHEQTAYDVGLITKQVSIMPDNVSFAWLSITEKEAYAKGSGSLSLFSGVPHNASGAWIPCLQFGNIGNVVQGQGTLLPHGNAVDDAYISLSNHIPNGTPPNPNLLGTLTFIIPWNYAKSNDLLQERLTQKIAQVASVNFDASFGENTMSMVKKTEQHIIKISDPTVKPIFGPNGNVISCQ